jgi:hypothetical protein
MRKLLGGIRPIGVLDFCFCITCFAHFKVHRRTFDAAFAIFLQEQFIEIRFLFSASV